MSEIFEAVEKRLLREKDQDETVALWRRIWTHYDQHGSNGVEELMDNLLAVPEGDE